MTTVMPFNPYIPLATKLRAFKLVTPRRELQCACACCARVLPIGQLDNNRNCQRCRLNEFNKGE